MGAGRTETARAVIGADRSTSGTVEVHGNQVRIRQPADAVRHGIGYLSEDRKTLGLMLEQSVTANTIAASYDRFTGLLGVVNDRRARRVAAQYVEELRTRTPSVDQPVKLLSGGNQQKVVIAKWLVRDCEILIVDEPTRGIDVGAKEEIYRLLQRLAAEASRSSSSSRAICPRCCACRTASWSWPTAASRAPWTTRTPPRTRSWNSPRASTRGRNRSMSTPESGATTADAPTPAAPAAPSTPPRGRCGCSRAWPSAPSSPSSSSSGPPVRAS
ncbi:ATP-binding cassette domain-containing protein [Brachybacterium sp. Z12]|uniref:ATP-binding cassette domain-containing protein n=1 Tax=Brachybacterium sp. Z12 TaxID=2759167 RepID=UPI00223BF9D8|nr:ATP-binding cassette domain-containing protein [Brachybacterium sp. Z12]